MPDPTTLPLGLAFVARNVRYKPTSVGTRFGLQVAMQTPGKDQPITAVGVIPIGGNPMSYLPFVFDLGGKLYVEQKVGSGALRAINPSVGALPANAFLRYALAYNKAYLMFSDLKTNALASPMVLDGATGVLDPLSDHLMGETWAATTAYIVGNVVTPATKNAHQYVCTVAGTSGAAQPAFPTGAGATVTDSGVTWKESTPTAATTANAGNICSGDRFMVVLFQNRNGCIIGMDDGAPIQFNIAANGKTLLVSNLPIGPANTYRRILAFTVGGVATPGVNQTISSAGIYKYIPKADSFSGVAQSATVVPDNVTTQIELNFTDDFLADGIDVTNHFRKMQVPPGVDIYYAESLDRMIYQVPSLYPSGFLVSLPGADPESVYGDTGVVQVAQNNGQRAITWREFRGVQYALKEASGHEVKIDANDPAKWEVIKRWDGVGPCGPAAADVTTDFMVMAHESGPHIYQGGQPLPVGTEILGEWQQINWQYKHLISVAIDPVRYEVHFLVPYRDSTVPNKDFRVNYREGWEAPYRMSSYTGHLIVLIHCRKWSIDDIPANMAVRVQRDISALYKTPSIANFEDFDRRIFTSQMLFASSAPDGIVNMELPGAFNDNGGPYESIYETSHAPQGGGEFPVPAGHIYDLGGFSLNAIGNKVLGVSIYIDRSPTAYKLSEKLFDLTARTSDVGQGLFGLNGNRFKARFSNNNVADAWFELAKAAFHIRPLFKGPSQGNNRAT